MQKVRSTFGIVLMVLLFSVTPIFAVAPDTLTQIAEDFPVDTPMLLVFNIDEQMVEKWEALTRRLMALFPNTTDDADISNLAEEVDKAVKAVYPDGDFETTIRPWLGDAMALGLLSVGDDEQDTLVVIQIRDREAATDFLITALDNQGTPYVFVRGDDHHHITVNVEEDPGEIHIYEDRIVVFIGETFERPTQTLNDNPLFHQTVTLLPLGQYDVSLYLDLPVFMRQTLAERSLIAATPQELQMMETMAEAIDRPMIVAFGLQDETQFILDVAYPIPTGEGLAALGLMNYPAMQPLNLDFARFAPADAVVYTHSTDLKQTLTTSAESFLTLMQRQAEAVGNTEDVDQINQMIPFLEGQFTSYTDLDFSEDVLGWMTGDYSFFANLHLDNLIGITPTTALSAFEIALVVEATDPAAAQNAARGLANGLYQFVLALGEDNAPTFALTERSVGTATVHVFSAHPQGGDGTTIELAFAANDEVFFIGTQAAVDSVFLGQNPLSESDKYAEVLALSLNNPTSLILFNQQTLITLIDRIAAQMNVAVQDEEDVADIYNLLQNLNVIAMSNAVQEDVLLGRFVLTLTDAD